MVYLNNYYKSLYNLILYFFLMLVFKKLIIKNINEMNSHIIEQIQY